MRCWRHGAGAHESTTGFTSGAGRCSRTFTLPAEGRSESAASLSDMLSFIAEHEYHRCLSSSRFSAKLMGVVAQAVMAQCHSPVLLVRLPIVWASSSEATKNPP